MRHKIYFLIVLLSIAAFGCSTTREAAEPVAEPVDETTQAILAKRIIKDKEGKTRAVWNPADKTQLKIPL